MGIPHFDCLYLRMIFVYKVLAFTLTLIFNFYYLSLICATLDLHTSFVDTGTYVLISPNIFYRGDIGSISTTVLSYIYYF